MAASSIKKQVKFKKADTIKLYASAKNSAKTTNKKVDTKTVYNATKLDGSFYYISEFKKWIKKTLVQEATSKKTNATTVANNAKYRFKNLKKSVYTYKSSTATKESGTFKPEDKIYTVSKQANSRSLIKEINLWVKTSTIEKATLTHAEETAKEKVAKEKKKQEAANALNKVMNDLVNVNKNNATTTGGGESATVDLDILNTVGIWGIPYQQSKYVDPKLGGTTFGMYYADRVISRMPLLVLSPGKVAFMKGSNAQDTDTVRNLLSWAQDSSDSALSTYLEKPGKYYSFEYDNSTYWEYVNTMNMASAIFLGIGDIKVEYNGYSAKLKNFKWEKATNKAFSSAIQATDTFITFFADSESSAGEGFSNSTSESMLAGTLNKSSELGREIRFLLGENNVLTNIVNSDTIDAALEGIASLTEGVLGEGNIVSQISREFAVIASGGKLIFPELWSDSQYTSDFDVKIKLRCPCPNKVAWFLDIVVPLNCLKALTMPRTPYGQDIAGQLFNDDVSANGYFSPFLVRGFYKGISTVDLGIVTSLSIDKGKEGSWTVDGLPTEVDVSLTIKDLYNTMAMTSQATGNGAQLVNNTQFLSYLAFNCGISINQPDIIKSTLIWGTVFSSAIYNNAKDKLTLYKYWRKLTNAASNKMVDIVSGLMR